MLLYVYLYVYLGCDTKMMMIDVYLGGDTKMMLIDGVLIKCEKKLFSFI